MEKLQKSIENIRAIANNPIEGDTSSNFESVREELLDYKLQYVERLDKGLLEMPKSENSLETPKTFVSLLIEYTGLKQDLMDKYEERLSKEKFESENRFSDYDDWVSNIFKEINDDYLSGDLNWRKNVKSIINKNLNKVGSIVYEGRDRDRNKKEQIGLLSFNIEKTPDLEKYGISREDDCLSIHFGDLYKQKKEDSSISNIFSKQSLSKLAIKIVEEYPQVQAILAKSWLLDSPIGKRIEFTNFEKKEVSSSMRGGFWGQFINEKGEIKKDRIEKFLNTGVPDFYLTKGFMKTEYFLRKYLPEDKKGTIKLRQLTEESKQKIAELEKFRNEIGESFKRKTPEEIVAIINKYKVARDYYNTEKGKIWLLVLEKSKELNIPPREVPGFDLKDLQNDFDNYLKSIKQYENKELTI